MRNPLGQDTGRNERSRRNAALLCTALFLFLPALSGCSPILVAAPTATPASVVYHNSQYGFSFSLPAAWTGYSIVVGSWTGTINDPNKGDVPAVQGPLISIRHPLWTEQAPRQDIPIMVFTHPQWDALQRGEFLVSPAPIGPIKLGQNANYVFALPPRFDYAYPTGWQEVENIVTGQPLHTP